MRIADGWQEYKILDASGGEKLERWGGYTLIRPDPQIIWSTERLHQGWSKADGHYLRSPAGGGSWQVRRLPEVWSIPYQNLRFNLKPMGFKHTGLFPEQAVNWDWLSQKIGSAGRPVRVLNLFAYTGAATLACAAAGAEVVHCDAAKGMVAWAKENAALCGLADKPVRYIVDDCIKFVQREARRGRFYDAVIMDPPSFGRGPGGEVWKLEEQIFSLLELCKGVVSENPLFFMLNSYTTGLSPSVMAYLLGVTVGEKRRGRITADEIGLPVESTGLTLPCGATAIWEA
ncbi:MAG: class I SAM-dependent methyltransferase [Clostridia bacterium]|nr:class I SAM-dependent methyltransferase [Clostridia bacterium]MDR3643464.1 class I SAM-dependent methyltransferase [Clostridia bacterium]